MSGSAVVLHRTTNSVDLETPVGVDGRVTTRVDVRLAPEWSGDAARVWVRNSDGEFERLSAGTSVAAVDALPGTPSSPLSVRFRIEADSALPSASLIVPVEYRLRVGSGEHATVWTVQSLLRVDAVR